MFSLSLLSENIEGFFLTKEKCLLLERQSATTSFPFFPVIPRPLGEMGRVGRKGALSFEPKAFKIYSVKIDDEWSLSNNWLVTVFFQNNNSLKFKITLPLRLKWIRPRAIRVIKRVSCLIQGSKKNDFCLKKGGSGFEGLGGTPCLYPDFCWVPQPQHFRSEISGRHK